MFCLFCSSSFNLGLNKPMQICCGTICLSCLESLYASETLHCPNQHSLPHRSSIIPNFSTLEMLQEESRMIKDERNSTCHIIYPHLCMEGQCTLCKTRQKFPKNLLKSEYICNTCKDSHQAKVVEIEDLKCLGGHRMIESVGRKETKNKICATCKRLVKSSRADCKQCKVSLCGECKTAFKLILRNSRYFTCNCQGELVWKWYVPCEKCKGCGRKFAEFGSFSCVTCRNSICLSCVSCLHSLDKPLSLPLSNRKLAICVGSTQETVAKKTDFVAGYAGMSLEPQINSREHMDYRNIEKQAIILQSKCKSHNFQDTVAMIDTCYICKKTNKQLWFCTDCNYLLCMKCRKWYSDSEQFENDHIKCFRGHFLRKTRNPEKYYKREGHFLCDGCKLSSSALSAHCRNCKVDYCAACLNILLSLLKSTTDIVCQCNGTICWSPKNVCKNCDHCQSEYHKSGSFSCATCNKRYCIRCMYTLQSMKCSSCGAYTSDMHQLFTLTCGHNMCLVCFSKFSVDYEGSCRYDEAPIISYPSLLNSYAFDMRFVRPLSFLNSSSRKTSLNLQRNCDLCKKKKDTVIVFEMWNYILCNSCCEWIFTHEILEDSKIRCFKKHYLRRMSHKSKYNCDGCKSETSSNSVSCKACKVDFCQRCLDIMKFLVGNISRLKCECSSEIIWKYSRTIEKCSGCKKKYDKCGSFLCKSCKNSYCLRCIYKSLKCVQCKIPFGDSTLPIMYQDVVLFCSKCFLKEFSSDLVPVKQEPRILIAENLVNAFNSIQLQTENKEALKSLVRCDQHQFLHIQRAGEECDLCGGKSQSAWTCSLCTYIACTPCKDCLVNTEILDISAIKCVRNHYFRFSKHNIGFYDEKFCSGCKLTISDGCVQCYACSISLCVVCMTMIKINIKRMYQILCKCGNQLSWRFDLATECCGRCSGKYENSGSFYCVRCNFSLCIRCCYIYGNISNQFQ